MPVTEPASAAASQVSQIQQLLRNPAPVDFGKVLAALGEYQQTFLKARYCLHPQELLAACELTLAVAIHAFGADSQETLTALKQLATGLFVDWKDCNKDRVDDVVEAYVLAANLAEKLGQTIMVPLPLETAVQKRRQELLTAVC